jgi:hypothetical protein
MALHQRFGLPQDRPLFRIASALHFSNVQSAPSSQCMLACWLAGLLALIDRSIGQSMQLWSATVLIIVL